MRSLFIRWLINTLALYVAVQVVDGLHYDKGPGGLLIVAAIFGLVNSILRPILTVLTCPLVLLTLGLFTLVINGLMFYLAAHLVDGFHVTGFGSAFLAALLYSLFSFVLNMLFGTNQ